MNKLSCCLYALLTFVSAVDAQEFPSHSVRLVVPLAPGGANDIVARVLSQKLTERWGQQVVVDNRSGADGRIGYEFVAKSVPNGYTWLVVSPSLAIAPNFFKNLPYDTARDFAPVSSLAYAPQVLVVHPSFPARSIKEFIAIAKARPGEMNYGSPGQGTTGHLSGELFRTMSHTSFVHVPYRGASQALTDLLAGQLSFAFVSVSSTLQNVKAGKLRPLGVTSLKRFDALPDIPTIDESGVKGYETTQWFGLVTPANVPKNLVLKINADIVKEMSAPSVHERVAQLGAVVWTGSPDDFAAFISAETIKWAKVIKESGARPE